MGQEEEFPRPLPLGRLGSYGGATKRSIVLTLISLYILTLVPLLREYEVVRVSRRAIDFWSS